MIELSRNFKIAVKLNELPLWKIAQQAGVNPATLSNLMRGRYGVRGKHDERVLMVAKVLELKPEDCFDDRRENQRGRNNG